MSQAWRPRTRAVHGGSARSEFGETSEALFLTSGFRYRRAEDAAERFAGHQPGFTYSRLANPTVRMFEERLALLEGAEEAAATATGMAAVHAALTSQLKAGDRVVAARLLFGSCQYILSELLPRFGVETVLVDGIDPDAWALPPLFVTLQEAGELSTEEMRDVFNLGVGLIAVLPAQAVAAAQAAARADGVATWTMGKVLRADGAPAVRFARA